VVQRGWKGAIKRTGPPHALSIKGILTLLLDLVALIVEAI
jgi:hypothetical protein